MKTSQSTHLHAYILTYLHALLLCFLAGCIETKEEYSLNPDGSGKVICEITQPLMAITITEAEEETGLEKARDEVEKILQESKGVEVWKDVTFKLTDDGKLYFKGAAYFRKLSALNIGGSMKSEEGQAEFVRLRSGGMRLRLWKGEKKKSSKGGKALSKSELARKVKTEKAKFAQSRPMIVMMLTGFRDEKIFHLPGKLNRVSGFKRNAATNTVRILVKGDKVLKAIDALAKDDAWWAKQVLTGRSLINEGPPMDADLCKKLFGAKGFVAASVKGTLKPLFNYRAEVARAKRAYPALRKKLGLAAKAEKVAAAVLPPAAGGRLKNLRVGGVQIIHESDQKKEIRPFNYDKGYALSLIAELPGAVMRIKEAKITKAQADTGEDLLPSREWDRKIHFPKLSANKSTVILEVKLKLPGTRAKGLKELSGELIYVVNKGTKTVDLGMLELKAGAKGKALGAEIKSLKESKWQKAHQELELKLEISRDQVKEVRFADINGNKLPVSGSGSWWSGRRVTLTYRLKGEFPAKARIMVEVYAQLQEYKVPFKLSNVSLIGLPLK